MATAEDTKESFDLLVRMIWAQTIDPLAFTPSKYPNDPSYATAKQAAQATAYEKADKLLASARAAGAKF